MKRGLFLAAAVGILFLCCVPAPATDVGGNITVDTVWTPAGSPYVLTNDLTVLTSRRLEIRPGVDVRFSSNATLRSDGEIVAKGTADSNITFAAINGYGDTGDIFLWGNNISSLTATGVFEHCVLTRMSASSIFRANFAVLSISNCVVSNVFSKIFTMTDSRIGVGGNYVHDVGEAMNAVRCAGHITSNIITRIIGYADGIDLDAEWTGGGDPSMVLEWNLVSEGSDPDADGIDLGTSDALLRGNVVSNFGDKGFSIGEGSNPEMYNNYIYGCAVGISIKDGSDPVMANNTVVECDFGVHSYEKTGGWGGGQGSMYNCIVWDCGVSIALIDGSQLAVSYSAIEGDDSWPGPGNTAEDPEFMDPAAGDYRLRPGSPCVDTGTNMPWMSGSADIDGNDRIINGTVDMGAYELLAGDLTCGFVATPRQGMATVDVVFTASVSGTNQDGLVYRWDYNNDAAWDAEGPGLAVVTNPYALCGIYSVMLQVTNDIGEVGELTKTDYIKVGAPVMYVRQGATPVFPYTNWTSAATNIQMAVNAGVNGTVVRITNGVYEVSSQIVVSDGVTVESVNGAGSVTVDAWGNSRCFYLDHEDAVVDGLTITGGRAENGGAVYLNGHGTVRNCTITGNTATNGGGVYLFFGGTAEKCVMTGNSSKNGGAAYCEAGGLLRGCLINSNSVSANGGGVFFSENDGAMENCTVIENSAIDYGGGVRCADGGDIRNSIVYYNGAAVGANHYNNGATFSWAYSCMSPWVAGDGNSAASPELMTGYYLLPGSPAMDGGTNMGWMSSATDLDGKDRVLNGTVDMGCYEHETGQLMCNAVGDVVSGMAPLTVTFTSHVDGTNTNGLVYLWDFNGDGSWEATGTNLAVVTNTYSECGAHTVILLVSNELDQATQITKANYITVSPPVVYVSHTGSATYPYTNWDISAKDIQTAVDAGVAGTVVIVTDGVFNVSAEIVIVDGITVRSLNGRTATTVDANYSGRCFYLGHASAVVDGLTITRGNSASGGGIICNGAGTVQNCIIVGNNAWDGGGVLLYYGGTVRNCLVYTNNGNNSAGGVYCYGGGLVEDTEFVGNTAQTGSGGGLVLYVSGTARNCRLIGNESVAAAGGAAFLYGGGLVENCLAYGNTADTVGGGICTESGGVVQNCTIAHNDAVQGGGVRCHSSTIRNSIIYSNAAILNANHADSGFNTYYFSCSTPLPVGQSNITSNPLFMDSLSGDFMLDEASPCIDEGGPLNAPAYDIDGMPRPLDGDDNGEGRYDMGVYEFVHTNADTDADSMPDFWEIHNGLDALTDDAENDPDGDTYVNSREYGADTSPTNPGSLLAVTAIDPDIGGTRIGWHGGVWATQYLEYKTDLTATGEAWVVVFTNDPPTAVITNTVDIVRTNRTMFYRIRAVR